MEVEIPSEDGNKKLGENVHGFLAWRKSLIMFDSDDEGNEDDDQPHSPHRDLPPPSPPHRQSPTPLPPPTRKSPTPPPKSGKNRTQGTSRQSAPSSKKSEPSVTPGQSQKKLPADMTEAERKKHVSASVTSHFKKVPSPEKTKVDADAQKFFLSMAKVQKTGQASDPAKMSDYERISRKQYLKAASADALRLDAQADAAQRDTHVQGLRWKFFMGKPLVEPAHFDNLTTQLRRVHQWYMQQSNEGMEALAVRYAEQDFHNGDNIFWVGFEEFYMLYQQDALDVNILRLWTLMEIQTCRRNDNDNLAFLDPGFINEKLVRDNPQYNEDYLFNTFIKLQYKTSILLPYNFKFHWVLLVIQLDASRIFVLDSRRKPTKEYQDFLDMLNRAFARYCKKSVRYRPYRKHFEIVTDFPCMRQDPGNNLCAFYVCTNIHSIVTESVGYNEAMRSKLRSNKLLLTEILAIQEQIAGFIHDEVINPNGEFHG